MPIRKILTATVLAGTVFISGCASFNKAPAAMDAEAKQFKTSPSSAHVYVYRNETLGAALSMPVTVDGKLIGSTGPKSYFKLDLAEGKHVLTSQGDKSTLEVQAEKNHNYYVWQEVKMGAFSGGSKLQLVSDAKGQEGVKECSLIQSN